MHAFRRYLSPRALAAAETLLKQLIADWGRRSGATVHLRSGDGITFYLLGHKAVALSRLDTDQPLVTAFKREPEQLDSIDELCELLNASASDILCHIERNSTGERFEQAAYVNRWCAGDGEFLLVDEQIGIPRAALVEESLARVFPDALLLHRPTGDLWLVEVKLATNDELDGPVLRQLDETARLPAALEGGTARFVAHYSEVIRHRALLGIGPNGPPCSGVVRTALLALGDPREASGRIACWGDLDRPADVAGAIRDASVPLALADLRPLDQLFADALAGERVPHAPRRARWNAFTQAEDDGQATWLRTSANAKQLGPLSDRIEAYLAAHDAPRHNELEHPRSSQAACLQALAPVLACDEVAVRGLLAALQAPLSLDLEAVESCDFEVPHRAPCRAGCMVIADMREVAGERGAFSTRLDAALVLRGRREGVARRVLLGLEFKYSEAEFGCCGGFVSDSFGEEGARACVSASGERANRCYLRHVQRRTYLHPDALVEAFGRDLLSEPEGPCPFLGPLNQLVRGHFTTRALVRRFGCDEGAFVVLYDGRNEGLVTPERPIPGLRAFEKGPLERYRDLLRPELQASFSKLTSQDLVAAYLDAAGPTRPAWLQALIARYRWAA